LPPDELIVNLLSRDRWCVCCDFDPPLGAEAVLLHKSWDVVWANRQAGVLALRRRYALPFKLIEGKPSLRPDLNDVFLINYSGVVQRVINFTWTNSSNMQIAPDGKKVLIFVPTTGELFRERGVYLSEGGSSKWVLLRKLDSAVDFGWAANGSVIFADDSDVLAKLRGTGRLSDVSLPSLRSSPNGETLIVWNSASSVTLRKGRQQCQLPVDKILPTITWSPDSRHLWIAYDNRATFGPTTAYLIDAVNCSVLRTKWVISGSGVNGFRWVGAPEIEALARFLNGRPAPE
jgi:hypothetical protein